MNGKKAATAPHSKKSPRHARIGDLSFSTVKVYHKFHLVGDTHLCGKVVYPSESTAEVKLLGDGNVVPFIKYHPALATDAIHAVVFREIRYAEPATPPGDPPTPAL